jgi:inositol-hexakisphosphate/diphosphoinositol-pentakisphosphate 1-kinase
MKEVIELLSSFRTIMHNNFENLEVDKIQDRWYLMIQRLVSNAHNPSRCCGDEPWLFRERWEKLFEDFCDVEQKKFDPSRVRLSGIFDLVLWLIA